MFPKLLSMLRCHVCTAVVDAWVCLQPSIALHISNSPSVGKHSPVSTRRDSDQGCFASQSPAGPQIDKLSRLRKHSQAVLAGLQGAASPFRDNDGLAALLAVELQADLLVLLTDVDGLYTGPPTAESSL